MPFKLVDGPTRRTRDWAESRGPSAPTSKVTETHVEPAVAGPELKHLPVLGSNVDALGHPAP